MRLLYPATGFIDLQLICIFLVETIQDPCTCSVEIGETVGVEEERLYLTIPGFYITVVYAAGIDHGE